MTDVASGHGRRPGSSRWSPARIAEPLAVLLGNRSLSLLVAAFAALTVAEWGYVTALAVDAFRRSGEIAVGLVGLRLFFAALSSFVSIPFVERHPGPWLLTWVAAVRAGIVASSAALAAAGAPLAPLIVLVTVDAMVSALYRPAQASMLPGLARTPNELAASAAGISTVKTLSQAAGAVIGGFLLLVTTPATIFAAASLLLIAAAAVTTSLPRLATANFGSGGRGGITEVVHETIKVMRHPHVSGILIVSGLRTFVRGMWLAIAVIASLQLLHAGSGGVGLLMMAAGIGSLAAVPISASMINRPRLGTPAALALIACGIPLALLAGIPKLDLALGLVAAWGIGMAVADVATLSLMHRLLDAPVLPRVTGAIESAKLALEGLGALLAPVLASVIGIRGALVAAAAPLPIVVVAGWRTLHRLDATATERASLLELLHGVPCLHLLDMAALEELAARLEPLSVSIGSEVVRQGDKGDRFYVVRSGTAEVLIDDFVVGSVGPGDGFGEKALLRRVARTATVKALAPMELLALSAEDFLAALTGREDSAGGVDPALSSGSASSWTPRKKAQLLSRVSLLSHLDSRALGVLADRSVVHRWPTGSTILRRGEEGDRFFVMLDGRAEVRVGPQVLSELHPGDQFGEIALLHGVARSADVTTASPATTLSLHRDDFVPAVRSRMLLG